MKLIADIAQLVERRYRKPQVVGPIPTVGSVKVTDFRGAEFYLLNQGEELTGAERRLVNQEIDEFIQDHLACTGTEPLALYGTLILFAPRLEQYGFRLPRVEIWEKEAAKVSRVFWNTID